MIFEQAFYTWRGNVQSRHHSGLGIAGASFQNPVMLEHCCVIGSDFQPEKDTKTTIFQVYSEDFDTYIGVGISPAKAGEDGRANMLCHFFIPQQKEHMEPEQFLVEFPFSQELPEQNVLSAIELPAAAYDFEQILDTYHLHKNRLARLLYKCYQILLREQEMLTIFLEPGRLSESEMEKAAREIIWLLHKILPFSGTKKNLYYKDLSYGVNTTTNRSAIRFHFTNSDTKADFCLMPGKESEEEQDSIPELFLCLADFAEKNLEEAQLFLQELFSQPVIGRMDFNKLVMCYWNWKLDHGYAVSRKEIEAVIPGILRQSEQSAWHHNFLKKCLFQNDEDTISGQQLLLCWKRLIPRWSDAYLSMEDREKQEIRSIVDRMIVKIYEQDPAYGIPIWNSLSKELKEDIRMEYTYSGQVLQEAESELLEKKIQEMESIRTEHQKLQCQLPSPEQVTRYNLAFELPKLTRVILELGMIPETTVLIERGKLIMQELNQEYDRLSVRLQEMNQELDAILSELTQNDLLYENTKAMDVQEHLDIPKREPDLEQKRKEVDGLKGKIATILEKLRNRKD